MAGEQLVEDAAEREDVGPRVDLFAFDLLRRHVLRRADDDVRTGERGDGRLLARLAMVAEPPLLPGPGD